MAKEKILQIIVPTGDEIYIEGGKLVLFGNDGSRIVNQIQWGSGDLLMLIARPNINAIAPENGEFLVLKPFQIVRWIDEIPNTEMAVQNGLKIFRNRGGRPKKVN